MSDVLEWLKAGKYLPAQFRDFHDQKDLFKAIGARVDKAIAKDPGHHLRDVSWVQSHIYTVDYFLWFMGMHGWTLQRSRAKIDFGDLDEWIAKAAKQREATAIELIDLMESGKL